jgi:hypothetical protein
MKLRTALGPRGPQWLQATAAASAVLVALYARTARAAYFRSSSRWGLAFGALATLVFLFEVAYPLRRPRGWPLGDAQKWREGHVYLGLIALLAVVLHSGCRWPAGWSGRSLLLLSIWTTVTGLLGVWWQAWVPAALTDGLRMEALYERIPEMVQDLHREAETLAAGSGAVFRQFYETEVRGRLARVAPSPSFLLDVRSGRERELEPFRRIALFVDPADQERISDLTAIFIEKRELDAHRAMQGLLRRWPLLHLPAVGLLMGLLAVHVFSWVWY